MKYRHVFLQKNYEKIEAKPINFFNKSYKISIYQDQKLLTVKNKMLDFSCGIICYCDVSSIIIKISVLLSVPVRRKNASSKKIHENVTPKNSQNIECHRLQREIFKDREGKKCKQLTKMMVILQQKTIFCLYYLII